MHIQSRALLLHSYMLYWRLASTQAMVSGFLQTSGNRSMLTLLTHTQDLMYALDVGPIPAVLLPSTCTIVQCFVQGAAIVAARHGCMSMLLLHTKPAREGLQGKLLSWWGRRGSLHSRHDMHSKLISRPHRHGASQRCIVGVPHRVGRQALDSLPNSTCSSKAKSVCQKLHSCLLQLLQDTQHCI